MDGDVWIPTDTDLSSATDPDMTRLRDRLVRSALGLNEALKPAN